MSSLPPLPEAPPSRHIGEGYSYNHPVPTVQKYRDEKKTWDKEAAEYARLMESAGDGSVRDDETATMASAAGTGTGTETGTAASVNGKPQAVHATGDVPSTNHGKASSDGPSANERAGKKRDAVKSPGQQEKAEMMDRMNANKEKPTDRLKKGPHGERRVRGARVRKGLIELALMAAPRRSETPRPAAKSSSRTPIRSNSTPPVPRSRAPTSSFTLSPRRDPPRSTMPSTSSSCSASLAVEACSSYGSLRRLAMAFGALPA